MEQLDGQRQRYNSGAETISDIGEIARPEEASVLIEDEERLRRINRRYGPRKKKTVQRPADLDEHRKNGASEKPIRPEPSNSIHIEVQPPRRGEQILLLSLPKALRECLIGDLEEEYRRIQPKHGTDFANFWYWKQVTTSILLLTPREIIKWILFALIGEWVRRNNL